MTFVRTRLMLDRLAEGETLLVCLRGDEPRGNVPRTAVEQGHVLLGQRDEIITSIQAHPCNPATAAAAGFKVVTLMLEENGYPSLDALKAAVSERTAALMINNPDDMGVYNPEIAEWARRGCRRRPSATAPRRWRRSSRRAMARANTTACSCDSTPRWIGKRP